MEHSGPSSRATAHVGPRRLPAGRTLAALLALSGLSLALGALSLALAAPPAVPAPAATVILGPSAPTPIPSPAEPGGPIGTGGLTQAVWSPDGATLAVATAAGISFYDTTRFAPIRSISTDSLVTSVAYSPDGTIVGAGTVAGAVQCWFVGEAEPFLTVREQAGAVNSVAFSADGGALAAGYWDGAVRLWRVADGELLGTLRGHLGPILSVAYARSGSTQSGTLGSLLASGSGDGTARLWQADTGAAVRTLKVGPGQVNTVAFSPDGALLAVGSGDGVVRLFRVADGALLHTLEGHQSQVSSVAFSPDGVLLASASADGSARLWRAADGAALRTLSAEIGPLVSIAFAPDGATVGTGAVGGQVKVWAVQGLGGEAAATSTTSAGPLVVATESLPPLLDTAGPPLLDTAGPPLLGTTEPPPVETIGAMVCVNDATFVGDLTVPDGSLIDPGGLFDKGWRIRNAGTCPWGAGYQLVFVSGDILGAQNSVGVPLTDSGGTADVTVPMQAPVTPGLYTGNWQMADAAGQPFGGLYTVVIQVPPAGTPTTPLPPGVTVEISADQTAVGAGECATIRGAVEGVAAAWLDGDPVVGGHAEKNVCPCANTAYTLRSTLTNGAEVVRQVTITVSGACAPAAPDAGDGGPEPTATFILFHAVPFGTRSTSDWPPAVASDRTVKANVAPTNGQDVLARLAQVPVSTWNYIGQDPSIRHMGPMAQDFRAAFGLGEDERHITTVDADGVALAAIQALYARNQAQAARIGALEAEKAALQSRLDGLEARLAALEAGGGR